MNSHWQQRSTATQRLNVCSITCSERYELNRIIKTQMRWLVAAWLCVYLSAQALLVWPSEGGGGGGVFDDSKVQMGHSLSPSHTYTHTDSLNYLQQGVGQIYVLGIRHLLMVKNELYWMSYKMLVGRRAHKSWTGPCHTVQPRLLLLINSNFPTLCLMQCGSGWSVHCRQAGRPLLSVVHSRFNPHFRRPQSGLKATLTPAGC